MDYQSFRVCTASAQSVEGHLNCHFNLFPRTLVDIPLSDLLDCLSGTRPLGNFCLEISEERIGGDPSFLREPLLELKKAGVRIALEEVGFGHSSLESLLLLEPDVIKVAEGFTKGVEKSPAKMRSMERFLKMAAGWGAEVIVEGIQSLPELEALRGLGVPYGQGTAWNATA